MLDYLTSLAVEYGGWGILLATFIEQIVAPIPSAVVQTASGFLLLPEQFGTEFLLILFFQILLPAAIGVTVAAIIIYYIATFVGVTFVKKFGWWFGVTLEDIDKTKQFLEKKHRDFYSLLILRSIPIVPSIAVDVASGLVRLNLRTYIVCTFVGTLIRAAILAHVGWYAGEVYRVYADRLGFVEDVILWVFVILLVALPIGFRLFRRGNDVGVK